MEELAVSQIFGLSIKIYALMTPTAVLTAFITYTRDEPRKTRFEIAFNTSAAIFIMGVLLFLFGSHIFNLFGFTLDAFRIGVGLLLFLTAVRLMKDEDNVPKPKKGTDISVVPLAIPLGMGPSAIGTVMVLGALASDLSEILVGVACIFFASLGMALLLCVSEQVKKIIGRTGIAVMSKLTALLISAIAAQVIFSGIKGFLLPY